MGKEAAVRASTDGHFDGQGVTGFHCPLTALPISPRCVYAFQADSRRGHLIFTNWNEVPGSPGCARENLAVLLPAIPAPSRRSTGKVVSAPGQPETTRFRYVL